jgi:hypothetical protein
LTRLVEAVQERGVRVLVVSTMKTSPPLIPDALRGRPPTSSSWRIGPTWLGGAPREHQTTAPAQAAPQTYNDRED